MTNGSRSDDELLQALRSEPDAICALYDRYVIRLVVSLKAAGATTETAWDAAQETFARLLERGYRGRVAGDGTAWPWLLVTARNLLRDWQRRGRVDDRARRKLRIASIADGDGELDIALSRLEGEGMSAALDEALAALPNDQREAVTARIVDGVEYERYAAAAGTTEQAARRRVSRGLRAMKSLLEGGQR